MSPAGPEGARAIRPDVPEVRLGIAWAGTLGEALETARRDGRPVLVDFYDPG